MSPTEVSRVPQPKPGVLAVIDGYRLTGPARQLLAAATRGSNARITLAVFQRSRTPTPLIIGARRTGVPLVIIRDRFPGDPRAALALARLAAKPETDILQTHGYKANVLGALLSLRRRHPWVAFLHGDTWENWKIRAYFALERVAIRRATRIVVVSHQMARALMTQGIPTAKIRVIHNACLVKPPLEEDAPDWRPDAPTVIGVVGRLSPEKGVDLALRVQQLVSRGCKDAQLCVAGEGPEQASLQRAAERLEIASNVVWLGFRDDLSRLYREMAVLLIPSRSEGIPNVALEAMAHGVPVVATDAGGIPEVVAEGRTGFVVPSEDVEGLASRVLQLLENTSLRRRLGRQAREEVGSRFSPEARYRALAQLYGELVT